MFECLSARADLMWTYRIRERLAQDQTAILHPDVDSPFVDEVDVIDRLLPYHLFQQPKEDLASIISSKGKEKSTTTALCDEIQGKSTHSFFPGHFRHCQ